MPTCPGCGRTVQYHRLRRHVRACPGVWMAGHREAAWNAHLGAETERVERTLDALLAALDAPDGGDGESTPRHRESG